MLTEEIKKRLYLYGLIIAAILGGIFMVFAVFINHGTLIINGEAPFNVQINNIKNLNCIENSCQTTLAPGTYKLILKKDGYQDLNQEATIPIAGKTTIKTDFIFIPYISQLDAQDALKIFNQPELSEKDFNKLPVKTIYYDPSGIAYIAVNPQNNFSTLYIRNFQDNILGDEQIVSTFQRELKSFKLIPDFKNQRIGLIDYTLGHSTLYLINLKDKTRSNLLTFPFIKNIKWLPENNDVIIEGKDESDLSAGLYLYRAKTSSIQKLELNTILEDIIPVKQDRLIAATNQTIQTSDDPENLEGRLVVLNENSEKTEKEDISNSNNSDSTMQTEQSSFPQLNFIDFSLTSMQGRLIKTTARLPLPLGLKASQDQKSIYFFDDQNSYELHLAK